MKNANEQAILILYYCHNFESIIVEVVFLQFIPSQNYQRRDLRVIFFPQGLDELVLR